jgi:hypothetical protein
MDERDLLKALSSAIDDGRVYAALELKRLDTMDSPISVQADSGRFIYGGMGGIGAAFFLGDWIWAAGTLVLGTATYFAFGRPWIRRRMEARFYDEALADTERFKKLWNLRGVTLRYGMVGATCASPDGDWRRFVLDQLMGDSGTGSVSPGAPSARP